MLDRGGYRWLGEGKRGVGCCGGNGPGGGLVGLDRW